MAFASSYDSLDHDFPLDGEISMKPTLGGVAALGLTCAALISSNVANAALMYGSQDRFVEASRTASIPSPVSDTDREDAPGTDPFTETASVSVSQDLATAFQDSTLGTDSITAEGTTSIFVDTNFFTADGITSFSVDFSLAEAVNFQLSGALVGSIRLPEFRSSNNGSGDAGFVFSDTAGDILNVQFDNSPQPFGACNGVPIPVVIINPPPRECQFSASGVLGPGDYSITAFATATGQGIGPPSPFSGDGLASGRFAFTLTTSEVIPTPATWSLMLLGLFATNRARKRA